MRNAALTIKIVHSTQNWFKVFYGGFHGAYWVADGGSEYKMKVCETGSVEWRTWGVAGVFVIWKVAAEFLKTTKIYVAIHASYEWEILKENFNRILNKLSNFEPKIVSLKTIANSKKRGS